MSVPRAGILGLGSIGMRHARNLARLGCEVLGYDPSVGASRAFESDFGRAVSEREKLLAAADAIVVATPNRFHLDDLRDAIVAGKPTLVEKPLGHDPELAASVLHRANERGTMVAVAHNLRFRPIVKRVKQLVSEGALGEPAWARFCCASWLPDWRPGQDYRLNYTADPMTGGVIFDSIHEFDLTFHLLGRANVQSASAVHTGILDIASEDLADATLRHDRGCQTTIHLDYITRPRQRSLEIGGPHGTLLADLRSGVLALKDTNGAVKLDETHRFDVNDEYVAVVSDFISAVVTGGAPACPGREALETLKLACAARSLSGLPQAGTEGVMRQTAGA